MKSARVIMLGVAFVAAGGAAMLAKNMIKPKKAVVTQTTRTIKVVEERVLVAAKPIRLGQKVTSAMMEWQPWPKAKSARYVTHSKKPRAQFELSGSIARTAIQPGEPIMPEKLVTLKTGGVMAAILQPGMRAISTPIRQATAAGGFILPNDRVDVIVTRQSKRGRQTVTFSDTILSDVRVLAIGQNIEMKDGKKVANGKTATLELTPSQTQVLTAAADAGQISLALRSLADLNPGKRGPKVTKRDENVGTVKYLKYGVPTISYGQ